MTGNVIQFTPPQDLLVTFNVYNAGQDNYLVEVNPYSQTANIPDVARAVARIVIGDALQLEQYVEIRLFRPAEGASGAEVRVEYFDPLAPEFMDQISTALKMINPDTVNAGVPNHDDHTKRGFDPK